MQVVPLDPALGRELVAGVLTRIKQADPALYEHVLPHVHAAGLAGIGGFADLFSNIGSTLSTALTQGVSDYSKVLLNREATKNSIAQTDAAVKSQVAQMNAALQLQQQQTQDQIIRQQLQQQQMALLNTGNSISSGGNSTLLVIAAVAAAGLFLFMRPQPAGARR